MSEYTEEQCQNGAANRSSTSSPIDCVPKSEPSSGYSSSSPTPTSPQSVSPPHTLKRSRSSSFRLINRRISNLSANNTVQTTTTTTTTTVEPEVPLTSLIGWYPAFLLKIYLQLLWLFVFVILKELPFILPTLWISACLWIFWKSVSLPFSITKAVLVFLFVPAAERRRRKRTILISGGSSTQAIRLARNFYSAGARVVCCEVEGNFPLARFSMAVHRYYTIPKPCDTNIDEYIEQIKRIVKNEGCRYFVPVSETSSAYFDALVKPHIEALGCECICPDIEHVLLLDDTNELMKYAESEGLPSPVRYPVNNNADLNRLYDLGTVKHEPHFMVSVGITGCQNRITFDLPKTRQRLRLPGIINEQNPWLVVERIDGVRYVTCTTVRDSEVMCNVSCRIDDIRGLVPVESAAIERWLKRFFNGLRSQRKYIVGHMSFHFVVAPPANDTLVLTACEVGVRQAYVFYTGIQTRMVWKPCRHFSRTKSQTIMANGSCGTALTKAEERPKRTLSQSVVNLSTFRLRTLLGIGRRSYDTLFELWDPFPYCAYYYLQLPFTNLGKMLRRHGMS